MSDREPSFPLLELFSSFQGEGSRVGERQVFVRLAGCDLRCAYCDTPESYPAPKTARVQTSPQDEGDEHVPNPVSADRVVQWIARLDVPRGLHAAVSITGGEPLLHPEAVRAIAAGARALGLRVHLETGGHRPVETEAVLDVVDEVTPDLKLASATGEPTPWAAHEATYHALESAGKASAVKAVVAATTTEDEIRQAAEFAARRLPSAPLILQPVTPFGPVRERPSGAQLRRLHATARSAHPDVRVVPQVHRVLGVR